MIALEADPSDQARSTRAIDDASVEVVFHEVAAAGFGGQSQAIGSSGEVIHPVTARAELCTPLG